MTRGHHLKLPPGLVPRLLTAEQAAAYCNVGRENFEARVGVLGASPKEIAALLGHKTLIMAAHYSDEADREKLGEAAIIRLNPKVEK